MYNKLKKEKMRKEFGCAVVLALTKKKIQRGGSSGM